jgi:hypothetical protein
MVVGYLRCGSLLTSTTYMYNILMKITKKNIAETLSFITLTVFLFLIFILPAISLADTHGTIVNPPNPSKSGGKLLNPLGTSGPQSIPQFIHDVLIGVVQIGIPIVALAIIYCGFLFVAARGKPEAITKAKDALIYTLIGAALLLGAWAIANLIVDVVRNIS